MQARVDQSYPAAAHAVLAESESWISRLLQSLSEVAPVNMPPMPTTLLTSHASGWSNDVAPLNMEVMLVTLPVSKLSDWSKEAVSWNMKLMSLTLLVSSVSG